MEAIPPIAIGAIGAATIAALVSLLGLIISKEQKTSEFRQNWIDNLRAEITTYLSELNAITDASTAEYKSHAEKLSALSEKYSNLNKANFSIVLRLNQHEDKSKDILSHMKEFQSLAANGSLSVQAIRPIEEKFLNAARDILKSEWKRVKRGELAFRLSKYIAFSFMSFLILLITYTLLQLSGDAQKSRTPQADASSNKIS